MTFRTQDEYLAFLRDTEIDLDRLRAKKDWSDSLQEKLGGSFDVIRPRMPNGTNAQYGEWKIWFENILKALDDGIVLIGHSLGGIFLAKYLSENKPAQKVRATFLVAAPFDDEGMDETLGSFSLPESLADFPSRAGEIFLYQSKDDPVVPFSHAERYKEHFPGAKLRMLDGRGHFNQEYFPEIISDIQSSAF